MNKFNFHGKIISAKYCPEKESVGELKKKLLHREKEYLSFIENKQDELHVLKKNEIFIKTAGSNDTNYKKIMKKSYWNPSSHRNMVDLNAIYQNKIQRKPRKPRIDLKN